MTKKLFVQKQVSKIILSFTQFFLALRAYGKKLRGGGRASYLKKSYFLKLIFCHVLR